MTSDPPHDHPSLTAALVAALAELTVVNTGRTVNTGTYSYDYADLADVVRLTRPVLAAHGIVALTPVHAHDGALACTVVLLHESGDERREGPFPFPHGRDAQATGSMVTYHRRYALVAALGMAAGDDDDGAGAQPRTYTEEPAEPLQTKVGFRISQMTDEAKAQIRAYVESMGYPTKPADWSDGQARTILQYVRGLHAPGAQDAAGEDVGTEGADDQPAATEGRGEADMATAEGQGQ